MNAGFTIIKFLRSKVLKWDSEELLNNFVNNFGQNEILKEENFKVIQGQYIKNSYIVNNTLIEKLLSINEEENKK